MPLDEQHVGNLATACEAAARQCSSAAQTCMHNCLPQPQQNLNNLPIIYTLTLSVSFELSPLELGCDAPGSIVGQDKVGLPAGATRLLSPDPPAPSNQTAQGTTQSSTANSTAGSQQLLHFVQYGGLLQLSNLQLEGHAGSPQGGGGVRILKRSNSSEDVQAATFIGRLVTFM